MMKFNNKLNEALRNIPNLPGEDVWGRDRTFIHSEAIENNVVRIISLLEAQEGFGPDDITTILQESDADTVETGCSYPNNEAFEYGVRFGKHVGEDQIFKLSRDDVSYYWVANNENEVIANINRVYEGYIL